MRYIKHDEPPRVKKKRRDRAAHYFGASREGRMCLAHHVVELLVLVELALLLGRGVLVLLVFGHEVVHVGLSLGELHLVHALTRVPVEEGLAAEHGGELLPNSLEHLLDGGGVTEEGNR